jgi:hypothetical protein
MNFEVVFNVFLGILALLGCTLVIIFSIVFQEEKTIHPIYRSLATLPDADFRQSRSNNHQPRSTPNKLGLNQENISE